MRRIPSAPLHHAAILLVLALVAAPPASAQTQGTPGFEPQVGQAGKDVVWVPTPQALVDKMLDMAQVTPKDVLIDLGSGDGRTVITAAQRGLRASGIEYNPDMVALSTRNAAAAGVSDRATFLKADLFETDLSQAQVITMFLLPSINLKLRPKLLDLAPGTRIVSNTFTMEEWTPDQSETIRFDCTSWCTAHLWIIPAKVTGQWQLGADTLTLTQDFQMLGGALGGTSLGEGRLRGAEISFTVGTVRYTGRVDGSTMRGTISSGGTWTATRR